MADREKVELVDRVQRTGDRGKSQSYPWERWFATLRAEGTLVLNRGVDYDTSITGIIVQFRTRAKVERLRLSIRPSKDDSTLTVAVRKGRKV